ncbi:MAG: 2-dehydropantoate 2-reductase [Anaerolineales bacterium]|nr:2-dehydropantoate 2-reductase [Anaerolineales bacterium]
MTQSLRVLVFGAGAIGTYIGGALALIGCAVSFVEQPAAVEELRCRGLTLDLTAARPSSRQSQVPPGVYHLKSPRFYPSLAEAFKADSYDVALFALKSFDTPAAIQAMLPWREQMPPIVCLSNGVENEPALEAVLGGGHVIAGTVTSAIGRRAVGEIVLERYRGVGLAAHPLASRLLEAMNRAGLNARIFSNPAAMKWSKLLTNLPANATSAILDMTPAEVFAHPGLFRLEMAMLREGLAVMRALGTPVVNLPGTPVRALVLGTRLPEILAHPLMRKAIGSGRGGKMPSFHIDLHTGRGRSEVEWLNGAVVRYGQQTNIPTPVNHFLTETLLALTRRTLPLDEFRRQPEKLLARFEQTS